MYISANVVYRVNNTPLKNGVLGINEDGCIGAVLTQEEAQGIENIQHYDGVLVPGFINTHCHLELSHLRQKIAEKTGLTGFIKQILSFRQQPEEEIISAMQNADAEMYENGIVAVGDISNLLISKSVKLNSKIYYHTFVEVFGFNRPSEPIIEQALNLKKEFAPLKASIVPHAPYSVSSSLFNEIEKVTNEDDALSIHNQETIGENELFETGTGKFADFFAELGIAQNDAHNSSKNSLNYHLPLLSKEVNTLLVHNTFSSKADIDFAKKEHQKLYWCLCPNANLYIENTLPDVDVLKTERLKITLGTDSLASNHQLNILSEMQTLQEHKSISFEELLKWATLNGAEFLGIESQYGSFEKGKKPGVVLISNAENGIINKETTIKRLF
ncbi:MAG: amidohydrolase family protein [Pedobacter sp.]|jgi:cytosine/adenosine deaminase-related metal-dependent hydrolase|uniref:amidohydrolase family protein n=1 Tax=Pedobacter sp. TaxID=1411316 RepID=UPI0035627C7F